MAYAFAQNGNEPIVKVQSRGAGLEQRDFDWFKRQLEMVGVSPLHILWNAQEQFHVVPAKLLDTYLPLRKNFSHVDALAKANSM